MKASDYFNDEIAKIDKEIRKLEQLGMSNDKYFYLLQMERATKICELQYCLENNL